ncbi:hypothetical protein [Rhizobium laguerreae]|uniref:hypothetical protein n=1 Tax=Rhizobium laguerreae TaxID=1076926 RepID=UPI001C914831|nr:hypothetical protein [Rhizobium laguerreae]MBY3225733.1 hypothetical protein [Rhizobium laguerreae]
MISYPGGSQLRLKPAVDRAEFARQIAARLNGALDGVGSASVILDEIPRGDKFQRYRDLSG